MSPKNTIYLNIAGFKIEIKFGKTEYKFTKEKLKNEILQYYKGFLVRKKPKKVDFSIKFVERRIMEKLSKNNGQKNFINFYETVKENKTISFNHISIIQFQIILNNIIQKLLTKSEGLILHASATNIDRKAYIFIGKSRAGKSTVITMLNRKYPALADDTVILKKEKTLFYLYQTPGIEKEYWVKKNPARYQIGKIFFLKKARYFKTEKINNKEYILQRIISQLFTEKESIKLSIKHVMKFISLFDQFYFLYFAKDSNKLIRLMEKI